MADGVEPWRVGVIKLTGTAQNPPKKMAEWNEHQKDVSERNSRLNRLYISMCLNETSGSTECFSYQQKQQVSGSVSAVGRCFPDHRLPIFVEELLLFFLPFYYEIGEG